MHTNKLKHTYSTDKVSIYKSKKVNQALIKANKNNKNKNKAGVAS